jgi:predicted GIY-YIG superfamily endonuclease
MSNTTIYVLKLTNNKYYVGKTNDLERRKQEHLNGSASTWTKKYKPIGVEKIISNVSSFDEDKFVKEYMSKFGVENVRGGSYVKEELDEIQLYNLKKEIWAATDCCTNCGRKGHFVKDCFASTDVCGESLMVVWICEYCNKECADKEECAKHEKKCPQKVIVIPKKANIKTCFDCGKSGHYAPECPNKIETFNCIYCNKEFETQKGATFHENVHCHASKKKAIKIESGMKKMNNFVKYASDGGGGNNKCYRCGRGGHYSNECYANTHARGYGIDSDGEYDSDSDGEYDSD